MRRLVVALIIAMLAFSLAGCGGGGDEAAAPAETPAAAPAPVAPPASTAGAEVTGLSENEPDVFEPFPTGSTIATDVAERIAAKQPTLIYFYDSGQHTAAQNRKIIDSVLVDNRGLVDLVSYDIGKYTTIDSSGTIVIDPEFASDPNAQIAATMARTLGVAFTPFIVLTDTQGYIIWKHRGLADKAFLEREVQRATR